MHRVDLTPTRAHLRRVFRRIHAADPVACRTAAELRDQLVHQLLTYARAGDVRRGAGIMHAPSGRSCCGARGWSCAAGRTLWCLHRVLRSVLLAEAACALLATAHDDPDDLPEPIPCFAPLPQPMLDAIDDDPPARIPCFAPPPHPALDGSDDEPPARIPCFAPSPQPMLDVIDDDPPERIPCFAAPPQPTLDDIVAARMALFGDEETTR